MKVALTGTPGVGKTAVSSLVRSVKVISVNALAEEAGAVAGFDKERDTREVDVEKLAEAVRGIEGDALIEGHLSHLVGPDVSIVLRCSPAVLRERLTTKGWSEAKVSENVEAEAVDVVLIEALESAPVVCEIDTTRMSVEAVASAVEEILAGESEKYPVGNVDWSQEVLSWF
ncbi:TPA: AAA family ATPase [Thermoplasmata archaeon]|nr:AAA family ATPase [Thermoplasmata archaeon]